MNLSEHAPDTPRDLSVDEQQRLRTRLQQEGISEEEVRRILTDLNPSDALVVALTAEERSNYQCVSLGPDNYRIHIPVRSGLQSGQLVFDRITGLYFIKKLPTVDVLE